MHIFEDTFGGLRRANQTAPFLIEIYIFSGLPSPGEDKKNPLYANTTELNLNSAVTEVTNSVVTTMSATDLHQMETFVGVTMTLKKKCG